MPEFRLAPAAERDLEEIWRYTVETWSVAQAERYIDTLLEVCQAVADEPNGLGSTPCGHIRPGYRRCRAERHFVYFRAEQYGAAIIRILHERRDVSRHFD